MRFSIPGRLRWLALALVVAPPLGLQAAARGDEPLTPLSRGVADPDAKVGAVTSFRHTVIGLNLENGKSVWETAVEGVPLAFVDRRVLVLAYNVKTPKVATVVAIEPLTGRLTWRSAPIVLPEWAAVPPTPDHYFGHLVRVKDGDLWLKWLALARKPGGKVLSNTASGVARLDLSSHKVEMLDADKMPPPDRPAGVSEALAKLAARPVETPAGRETRVATAGKFAVALDVDKASVVLRRWDLESEKALPAVTLVKGGRFRATPFPAAGMVLIRPVAAVKGAPRAAVWQVFSLETGKQIARLVVEPDTMQPTIIGSRLYYAFLGPLDTGDSRPRPVPVVRQLRAVDLATRARLWVRPLETLPWDPDGGSGSDDDS